MADITFWTIVVVFVLAWGAPLILIVHHRMATVEARFREIRDALIVPEKPFLSPAHHYLKLFTRRSPAANATADELTSAIYAQFVQFQSWTRYAMSLSLLAVFSAAALYLLCEWTVKIMLSTSPLSPIGPVLPIEAVFALAGAYIWSLFELATRARQGNLTPDELFDVSIRYLAAVPIGYTAEFLTFDQVDGAFAFVAASFPLRDVQRWYRKRALEKMKFEDTPKLESTRAGYLSQVVDGLGPDTVARLEEIGIVTFTDLAYADPIRIMVKAGFSLRHIIQWMDHAMLAIYALDYKQKLGQNAITCALDAKEFYETHFVTVETYVNERNEVTEVMKPRERGKCQSIEKVAEGTGIPAVILGEIFGRVTIDPHVEFLAGMWYTGYAGKGRDPTPCPYHVSEA